MITMHGHLRTQELPVYGAKTLGVREGTLDLHGKVENMNKYFKTTFVSFEIYMVKSDTAWKSVHTYRTVSVLGVCLTETPSPLDRDPFPLGQRPLPHAQRHPWTETPPEQRSPWTETPLDRDPLYQDPPGQRPPWTDTRGQRPPWTKTPLDRDPFPLDRDPFPLDRDSSG